jgi:hypothetical protein
MTMYESGFMADFPDPPPPQGRTNLSRDPLAKLALAVLKDAIDLTFSKVPYSRTNGAQRDAERDIAEARVWLADWESQEPFSLHFCCVALETFSGHAWSAKAIAEAFAAGRMTNLSFINHNGGSRMQIRHRDRSGVDAGRTR